VTVRRPGCGALASSSSPGPWPQPNSSSGSHPELCPSLPIMSAFLSGSSQECPPFIFPGQPPQCLLRRLYEDPVVSLTLSLSRHPSNNVNLRSTPIFATVISPSGFVIALMTHAVSCCTVYKHEKLTIRLCTLNHVWKACIRYILIALSVLTFLIR
jgi:hypothetical protein